MKRANSLIVLVVGFLMLDSAFAQDALSDKSVHLRVENDRVRVLERTLQPGEREAVHSHPAYVIYVVKGGKMRIHRGDGKVFDTDAKAGDVLFRDPVTHWGENIGTTPVQVILVELKEQQPSPPTP